MAEIATLSLFRFAGLRRRLWAFTQMGLARGAMRRTPDVRFWKLCGSGTGEGFTPVPNTAVYAILATWPDLETARRRVAEGVHLRWSARAAETWTLFLATISARGAWSGAAPFRPSVAHAAGPLAALTRATLRPSILTRFWGRVPAISQVIGADPHVRFKIGLGEVPLLHQITFSIWPDAATMAAFARADGPHARAIQAVREGRWFREELYARFAVVDQVGAWAGARSLPASRAIEP